MKRFSVQQFFKNAAEVWASSPHLRSKSKLHHEIKQKSKRELKESQLPSKSEGCNKSQGFRGNCDSQGKLGMCPSLAEPDLGGFPKNYSCNVSCETMLLENHSNPVRQNRFAVCLCAVRRWVCYLNCLWIFLRLQFAWSFLFSRWRTADCLFLLDFNVSHCNLC